MPITSASSLERALELRARRAPRRARRGRARAPRACSARELARLERGDDQQHRVGAGGRRLVQLVGVDDEVLAQDRQRASPRAPRAGRRASRRSAAPRSGPTAPPRRRARRRRRSRSTVGALADRRPADGERRLCSAITRDAGLRERLGNGRSVARAPTSARSSSASGTLALAALRRSSRVSRRRSARARSCAERSPRAAPARWRQRARSARAPRRRAVVDRLRAQRARPRASRSARAAGVDRGAGVEHARGRARGAAARRRGSRASIAAFSSGVPPATSRPAAAAREPDVARASTV